MCRLFLLGNRFGSYAAFYLVWFLVFRANAPSKSVMTQSLPDSRRDYLFVGFAWVRFVNNLRLSGSVVPTGIANPSVQVAEAIARTT